MSEGYSRALAAGVTCADCHSCARCNRLFGIEPTSTECDFFPVMFSPDVRKYVQQRTDLETASKRIVELTEIGNELLAAIEDAVRDGDAAGAIPLLRFAAQRGREVLPVASKDGGK